jgi:hypothetical protein
MLWDIIGRTGRNSGRRRGVICSGGDGTQIATLAWGFGAVSNIQS